MDLLNMVKHPAVQQWLTQSMVIFSGGRTGLAGLWRQPDRQ
jgi:hypothetical protein